MIIMKKKKQYLQTESGNAINYVTYFAGMAISIILFAFLIFRANLYVVENDLKNSLHIAENMVLAIDDLNGGIVTKKEFPIAHRKMHIIPAGSYKSETLTSTEQQQLRIVGEMLEAELKSQLSLAGDGSAGNTMLGQMLEGNSDADKGYAYIGYNSNQESTSGEVYIYEPIYDVGLVASKHPVQEEFVDFISNFDVTGYIIYTLQFDKNNYISCTSKNIVDEVPQLQNGQKVEGATIETCIRAKIYSINNIFENRTGTGFFGTTASKPSYHIQVTQAADIVPASRDTRTQ